MKIFVVEVTSYNSDINTDTETVAAYHTVDEATAAAIALRDSEEPDNKCDYVVRAVTLYDREESK